MNSSGCIFTTFSTSAKLIYSDKIPALTIFSPGSTVGAGTIEESLALIAECINRAHKETANVVIVLENMVRPLSVLRNFSLSLCVRRCQAGAGNVIGSRFSDLGGIIKQVDDKNRVGVCLDTCEFSCMVS